MIAYKISRVNWLDGIVLDFHLYLLAHIFLVADDVYLGWIRYLI